MKFSDIEQAIEEGFKQNVEMASRLRTISTAMHHVHHLLSENGSKSSAMRIIQLMLKRLLDTCTSTCESLALTTVLSIIVSHHVITLSTILPVLLNKFEQITPSHTSLRHSLRQSLASFMSLPAAEPFYPLLMDALSKTPKQLKQKRPVDDEEEEEEEGVSQRRKAMIDASKIPLSQVIEMIISSLQYVDMDRLSEVMERWRPSMKQQAPTQSQVDPRKREEVAQATVDIMGKGVPDLQPDELLGRISDILLARLLRQEATKRYNQHEGYMAFLGRLWGGLQVFGVDLYDDLLDALFPQEPVADIPPADAIDLLGSYLSLLWFTGQESLMSDRVLRALIVIPPDHLVSFCSHLVVIDYDSLVPVLRQHLAPIDEQTVDAKMAGLIMSLIGHIRSSRPKDEWTAMREFLVESCRSEDAMLRSLAVEQGCECLDIHDARSLLYACEGDGDVPMDGGAVEQAAGGTRLDLAMAMARRDPELLYDLLRLPPSPYFNAKLTVLSPLVLSEKAVEVFMNSWDQHSDFWCKLLALKSTPTPTPFYTAVVSKAVSSNAKLLDLVMSRAPKDSITDHRALLIGGISMGCDLAKLVEFVTDGLGPEGTLTMAMSLANDIPVESCIQVIQVCLSMTKVFRHAVIQASLHSYSASSPVHPLIFLRTILMALTLHKSPLSNAALSILQSHISSLHPWSDPAAWPLLLKLIKLLLPHSLNLLAGLPADVVGRALQSAEVDLKRPVKEYLYGLPPSVRSRYAVISKHLE